MISLLFYVGSDSRTNLFEKWENDENVSHNQNTKDPLQMSIRPIIRARDKKVQKALNRLVKNFIWANPSFKEEPKSNQAFEGIRANKEVQKSINVIMAIDGNSSHDFGI